MVSGGSDAAWFAPTAVLRDETLQWIGHRSYAIYLWHWPVLVLAEAKWGPLSLAQRFVAIAIAIALSAVSLRLIEDPVRHSNWVASRPTRGLALGAALCAAIVMIGAISLALPRRLDSGTVAAAPVLALGPATSTTAPGVGPPSTSGAAASGAAATATPLSGSDLAALVAANRLVLDQGLTTAAVPSNMRPSLAKLFDDRPAVYPDGCVAIGVDDQLKPCRYGNTSSSIKIVVIGDSHAASGSRPCRRSPTRTASNSSCWPRGLPNGVGVDPHGHLARTCPIWRDKAVQFIAAEHPDLVIVTGSRHYPNTDQEWRIGFDPLSIG